MVPEANIVSSALKRLVAVKRSADGVLFLPKHQSTAGEEGLTCGDDFGIYLNSILIELQCTSRLGVILIIQILGAAPGHRKMMPVSIVRRYIRVSCAGTNDAEVEVSVVIEHEMVDVSINRVGNGSTSARGIIRLHPELDGHFRRGEVIHRLYDYIVIFAVELQAAVATVGEEPHPIGNLADVSCLHEVGVISLELDWREIPASDTAPIGAARPRSRDTCLDLHFDELSLFQHDSFGGGDLRREPR